MFGGAGSGSTPSILRVSSSVRRDDARGELEHRIAQLVVTHVEVTDRALEVARETGASRAAVP